MDERLFLYVGLVPLLGVFGQWLAWRIKVPAILFLLLIGLVLGHWVSIDEIITETAHASDRSSAAHLLFPLISLSVAVILFEGGMSLRLNELKDAGGLILRLTTFCVAITWFLTSLSLVFIMGLHVHLAALLGAVFVVTGPTVVAPLIRNIRPFPKVASMVKWEGIIVDPIGAILAVLVLEQMQLAITGDYQWSVAVWTLCVTCLVGLLIGLLAAWILTWLLQWYWVPDYLHAVLILAVVLATFAVSNAIRHESGLITVTVLGIAMANQTRVNVRHIIEFKEHLGVLLISCLFVILGSRLDLGQIFALGWPGLAFLGALILVVRPLSIFLSLAGSATTWKERLFMGFLAPRGIVAAAITSLFALKLQATAAVQPDLNLYGDQVNQIVSITFLVIIGTVGIYGLSAAPLARALGLSDADPQGLLIAGGDRWVRDLAQLLHRQGVNLILVDTNFRHISEARMNGLRGYCASVLSDTIHEQADLSGIGRLLALTSSDEVNILACREYAHQFGRANVFQLPLSPREAGTRSTVIQHLPGRILFDGTLTAAKIDEMLQNGFEFKATTLSDEFTWEKFLEQHGSSARVLFLISPKKKLQIIAGDIKKPTAKHVVIAVVPQKPSAGSNP